MSAEQPPGFIDMYVTYHDLSTDAPLEFGRFMGIQLLGHAMGYHSYNRLQPAYIHHNMYLCLNGESTYSRKTTSQDLGRNIYPDIYSLPEETSPEKLIQELSWEPHRIGWLGEFSGYLKQIGRPGFMHRLVELLNDLHRCPPNYTRSLRGKKGEGEKMSIIDSYLSLNSTVTPTMFRQYLTTELMEGGFMARWLIVTGKSRKRPRGRVIPEVDKIRKKLTTILDKIRIIFKEQDVFFDLSDEALEYLNDVLDPLVREKYTAIRPIAARYLDYSIAIADILYLSDRIGEYLKEGQLSLLSLLSQLSQLSQLDILFEQNKGDNIDNPDNRDNPLEKIENLDISTTANFIVPKSYLEKAWSMVLPQLEDMNKMGEYVDVEKPQIRVMAFLEKKNDWVDYSTLLRAAKMPTDKLQKIITTLKGQKYLKQKIVEKKTKRGIVGTSYYMINNRRKIE